MKRIIVFILLVASAAGAQTITAVSGLAENGFEMTVSGAGFGVKSQIGPDAFEDFESLAIGVGDRVPTGDGTPWLGPAQVGVRTAPFLDDQWSVSGSHSGHSHGSGGEVTHWSSLEHPYPDGIEEVYVSQWVFLDNLPNWDQVDILYDARANWKGLRITSHPGPGEYYTSHDGAFVFPSGLGYTYEDEPFTPGWGGAKFRFVVSRDYNSYFDVRGALNTPHRQELYIKLSDPGVTNGIIDVSSISPVLGVQREDRRTFMTRATAIHPQSGATNVIRYARMLNGIANETPYNNVRWQDDVYISRDPRRIEIGNSPSFFDCSWREIQIESSWSNSVATFDVRYNDPNVQPGQTLYVFVVGDENIPSTGYPIVWQQQSDPPTYDEPTVIGHSGTLAAGNSVTVFGGGWGAKAQPGPDIEEDFENTGLAVGDPIPTGSGTEWLNQQGVRRAPVLADDWSASGSFSGGLASDARWMALERTLSGSQNTRGYISGLVYIRGVLTQETYQANDWTTGQAKLFRLNSHTDYNLHEPVNAAAGKMGLYLHESQGESDNEPGVGWPRAGYRPGTAYENYTTPWEGGPETWVNIPARMEMYYQLSDPAGTANGHFYLASISTQGANIRDERNVVTRDADQGDRFINFARAILAPINENPDIIEANYDDIYIDVTPQRVEIGNAPTLNGCTWREVQVATAWSENSITFDVRYSGDVVAGDPLYLFVMDEDNNPSAGFATEWGGQGNSQVPMGAPQGQRNGQRLQLSWTPPSGYGQDVADYVVMVAQGAEVVARFTAYTESAGFDELAVDNSDTLTVTVTARSASGSVIDEATNTIIP